MTKITYEFDSNDDEHDLKIFQNVVKFYFALDDIYNMTRTELKHGDDELSDHIGELLNKINQIAFVVHEIEN